KYGKIWKKTGPRKLLEEWIRDTDRAEDKNMKMLADMAVMYTGMPEFMEALSMGEGGDLKRCGGRSYSADAVQLMTLHGSKGLEFPVVLIYGAGKGKIPPESGKHPSDTEEERRLFYVGMTRAKDELIVSYTGEPSMFIGELDEKYMEKENVGKERKQQDDVQM